MTWTWKQALAWPSFVRSTALTLVLIGAIGVILPLFFSRLELRPGAVPWDPVLHGLGPAQLSFPIFSILYGTLVGALVILLPQPLLLLRGLQAFAIVLVLRMITMWTVTLEPPIDLVPLHDPLTTVFYPDGKAFTKDLFFSGHTATMALMVALARQWWQRVIAVSSTVAIGILVLAQHAHWTVDVLAAPCFVWLAWRMSRRTMGWSGVSALEAA